MKATLIVFVTCVAVSGFSMSGVVNAEDAEIQYVSIIQLLARGRDYHNKLVRVVEFCRLEFEGDALYLHEEDYRQSIGKNSVALNLDEWPVKREWRDVSDEYAIVEAVFDADDTGHLGGRAGSLKSIRRLERNRSRAEIERVLRLNAPER